MLRQDNPRLLELRERYARCRLPMALRSQWNAAYLSNELNLAHFRGDNVYVWQFRNVGGKARDKYHAYLLHLAGLDKEQRLLHRLEEDGLFGCWTFSYPGWPPVSRDLLDSINQLHFLDRHLQLLRRAGMTLLDIGAGYGRLAWRALAAAPGLAGYVCTDAVPESTFLCEYHLRFRGCNRAEVVPLDELDERLAGRKFDLAINTHSFSEMSRPAIDGWISRIARLGVPHLFIEDHSELLSHEADGTHPDYQPVLTAHGYRLAVKEPIVPPALADFMAVRDNFYLFALG